MNVHTKQQPSRRVQKKEKSNQLLVQYIYIYSFGLRKYHDVSLNNIYMRSICNKPLI